MSNCDVLEPYMETWKHIIRSTKSHIYIYIYILATKIHNTF